jgi:hypothetical protein
MKRFVLLLAAIVFVAGCTEEVASLKFQKGDIVQHKDFPNCIGQVVSNSSSWGLYVVWLSVDDMTIANRMNEFQKPWPIHPVLYKRVAVDVEDIEVYSKYDKGN